MTEPKPGPDNTAVRVALWRALHAQIDAPPHVLVDELALDLVDPEPGWRERPDMHPVRTLRSRASIVARARFVEDLVDARVGDGVAQFVLLGAGLDTFAQRKTELASRLRVYEIDQANTQAWKRARLEALGLGDAPWLRFVPVDFEANESWLERLALEGFDLHSPALVASTGVSMYLTKDAVAATFGMAASLASGSTLAMSFMLPFDLTEPEERPGLEAAARGAAANGTPFVSFFSPPEIVALARDAGFARVEHVTAEDLADRYFRGRTDGLRPSSGEELVVATT